MARRFGKRHQRKAALARVAELSKDDLSASMRHVAAGNVWTEERRAEAGRRLSAARALKRAAKSDDPPPKS